MREYHFNLGVAKAPIVAMPIYTLKQIANLELMRVETPMINRRAFFVGACCVAHGLQSTDARAQRAADTALTKRIFGCATVDPDEPGSGSVSVPFSSSFDPEAATELKAIAHAVNAGFTPFGVASVKQRWRREDSLTSSGPITIGVHFMNGEPYQQKLVRAVAPQWSTGEASPSIAFRFDVPRDKSHVRVSFQSGEGNVSAVGRTAKAKDKDNATMNIDDLFEQVILHEFGHAIGLQHEHNHPNLPFTWNEAAVIADAKARYGWSETKTRNNILNRFSKEFACVGARAFDPASIMMYPIPPSWTVEGVSFAETTSISERDFRCVSGLYGAK